MVIRIVGHPRVTVDMMGHEVFAKVLMRSCLRRCKKKAQEAQPADPQSVVVYVCAVLNRRLNGLQATFPHLMQIHMIIARPHEE